MQLSRVRRAALGALSVVAVGALAAPAAGAANAPLVAGGSFAQTVPFIDGTIYPFECHAFAAGATTTAINSCVLSNGISSYAASPVTSAGPFAITSADTIVDVAPYQLCWKATATYADATTQTTSGCTAASAVGGTGVSHS